MTQNREHFESFEPHTRAKHLILQSYFDTWARKLLLRPGAGDVLCYVDACAGAGVDQAGNPGSPVLAARSAREVETQLAEEYQRRVSVHTVAIEKSARRFSQLRTNLEPFAPSARALKGTLADHIEALFAELGEVPMLFFIDPFGLEPLRADVVRRALSGPRNELLALFADQAALRHFGAATAAEVDVDAEVESRMSSLGPSLFDGIDPDWGTQQEKTVREEVSRRREGRETTRPAAVEILNAAFGGSHWQPEIEASPPEQRRAHFIGLYEDLLRSCGAPYVISLPLRNDQDRHVYHLVYATKSPRGYSAMKEAITYALRHAPLPGEALSTMRFRIRSDLARVEQLVREEFAGRVVRLTTGDSRQPGVREFVLERTPAFPFEMEELKTRLKPLKVPGRGPHQYSFPALPRSDELDLR